MRPRDIAERALGLMRAQGFESAQVDASRRELTEMNIALNQPSLMRSTEQHRLVLVGLADGRRASTELTRLEDDHLRQTIAALHAEACAAPQDAAHALSAGERACIAQGPLVVEREALADQLADAVSGLLAFRAEHTPTMMLQEGLASYTRLEQHTLTSGGSELDAHLAWYELVAVGNAREGGRSSSFSYCGGITHQLDGPSSASQFGIDTMMRDLTRQTAPQPLGDKFVGEVLLTPMAVCSLLEWLLAQVGDAHLIAGSSVLREQVGALVASPLLTLRSRFDAPGVVGLSADAFAARPVNLLQQGRLTTVLPTLYGSRKTGLPHHPCAAAGWALDAGETALADMPGAVQRGAWVGRLSMGMPAANGDFSGVIKNSFIIEGGVIGRALSETMVSGNIAHMLRDVLAVSRERVDFGAHCVPWLRVGGLKFS